MLPFNLSNLFRRRNDSDESTGSRERPDGLRFGSRSDTEDSSVTKIKGGTSWLADIREY